ncbi:MAG: hypothetical protein II882_01230 [Lachnospiraceae bacterium]|nr:hypothetical protein [Lachnospiraceae bacterium]
MYTRELKDQPGSKGNCFYGSVCSAQVSYALDLPYRVVCKEWPFLPDMHPVDTDRLENLKLCDVIVNPKAHIAMITDIARDENGRVCEIEVSEETLPLSIRTGFSAEEFRRYWLEREYSVYRYDKVDEVGYTPDPFMPVEGDPELPVPPINRDLMPDYGNKANYRIGDEPVELSTLTEGWKEFELTAPDGTVHRYPVGDGPLRLEPAQAGIWNARLLGEGKESAPVAWCMVDLKAETDKNIYKPGEEIRLHFENTAKEDRVFHYVLNTESFYVLRNGDFTGREIADGCASFPAPDEEGLYNLIVLAKNQYGIYTSRYVYFRVEQAG